MLATKFGAPYEGHEGGASAPYVRTAVEDSLTRLGTDRIDLYQLHVPDQKTPIAETLGALGELVAEGKVREVGCSNFSAPMLVEAETATPEGSPGFVSVQNQYNLLAREPEDGVLEECERSGLAFLPYFPLAMGLLSGKYRAGEPPRGHAAGGDGRRRQGPAQRRAPGQGDGARPVGPGRGPQRARSRLRLAALPPGGGVGHRRGDQTRAGRRETSRREVGASATRCWPGSTRSRRAEHAQHPEGAEHAPHREGAEHAPHRDAEDAEDGDQACWCSSA